MKDQKEFLQETPIFYLPGEVSDYLNLTQLQYTSIVCLFNYGLKYKGTMRPGIAFKKGYSKEQQFELRKGRFTKAGFSKRGFEFAVKWLTDKNFFVFVDRKVNSKKYPTFNRGAIYTVNCNSFFKVDTETLNQSNLNAYLGMLVKSFGSIERASSIEASKAKFKAWLMRNEGKKYIPAGDFSTISKSQLEEFNTCFERDFNNLNKIVQFNIELKYHSKFGEWLVPRELSLAA